VSPDGVGAGAVVGATVVWGGEVGTDVASSSFPLHAIPAKATRSTTDNSAARTLNALFSKRSTDRKFKIVSIEEY